MRSVLLLDSWTVFASSSKEVHPAAAIRFVSDIITFYRRFEPQEIGFVWTRLPHTRSEKLVFDWSKTLVPNHYHSSGFLPTEIFYTLALKVFQEETLKSAHVPEQKIQDQLAKPDFPYALAFFSEDSSWKIAVVGAKLNEILLAKNVPGVSCFTPALENINSKDSRNSPLRLVPKLELRWGINFEKGRSLFRLGEFSEFESKFKGLPGVGSYARDALW